MSSNAILISESILQDVASAIKTKRGYSQSATIKPYNFASEIAGITSGSVSGTKTITENGTHDVSTYQYANVNVANSGSNDPLWNINITQSAHQTISVSATISKSGSSSYTIGSSDIPNVVATIVADSGYTAGTTSIQQSGNTFNVSATAATAQGSGGGDSSSFTKTYNNVTATISSSGTYFSMPGLGSYSDEWYIPSTIEIAQYYNHISITKGSHGYMAAYTFTGTLTLDGYELNFSVTNVLSGSAVSFTDNSNLSAFKTYYQSLGDGTHTFTTVVLTLTNISIKYRVQYEFNNSMDSSAMPNTIYYSQVVSDANSQLSNTVPSNEYLNDSATTTIWTPALPSSTVLTDSSNNCKWTFSGYNQASVGGDTINGNGINYYINYTWVATPL